MKKVLNFITLILICSCSEPSYEIDKTGLKSNTLITEGFYLTEIAVSEFNKEGRPVKYSENESVFCGPINRFSGYLGESRYNQNDMRLVSFNRQKMDTIMALNDNKLGGERHDQRIDEWIQSQNIIDSIVNKNFPFEAQSQIKFFETSKNYKWVYTTKGTDKLKFYDYTRKVLDTLPMKLIANQWYLLNFSNASNIIDKVFFKIKEDGKIEQYEYYKTIIGV